MAPKNQAVHLRLFMDSNQAEKSMEVVARKLGEVTDKVKNMKKALKESGLSKNASEDQFSKAGLGADFAKQLKHAEEEEKLYKAISKRVSVTIKDLNQQVLESAQYSKAQLDTLLRQIEKRYSTYNPMNAKDKQRMLELQHMHELVRQEIDKRNVRQMTGADAIKTYAKAEELMKQGAQAEAQALRDVSNALERAKTAEGVSLQQAQQYAQAQAEINRLLTARGTAFVDAAKGAKTLADAQNLLKLSREGKADTSVEQANMAAATRKREEAEKAVTVAERQSAETLKTIQAEEEKLAQKRSSLTQKQAEAERALAQARAIIPTDVMLAYEGHKAESKVLDDLVAKEKEVSKQLREQRSIINDTRASAENMSGSIKYKQGLLDAETAKGAGADVAKIETLKAEIASLTIERKKLIDTLPALEQAEKTLVAEYNATAQASKKKREELSGLSATFQAYKEQIAAVEKAEKDLADVQKKSKTLKGQETKLDNRKTRSQQDVEAAKQNLETLKQVEAETKRILDQAIKYGGVDITTLKQMYEELSFIRDHTKDNQTINEMNLALDQMKVRLQELQTSRMSLKELKDGLSSADKIIKDAEKNPAKVEVKAVQDLLRVLKDGVNAKELDIQTNEKRLRSIEKLEKVLKNVAYDEKFVNDTVANIKTAPIQDLEKAYTMLEQKLKEVQRSERDFVDTSNNLKKVKDEIDAIKQGFKGTKEAVKDATAAVRQQTDMFTKASAKLLSYLGIFGGFYLVRQKLTEAFKANIEYSDSLTNIQKTTQLTDESLKMMADELKYIDTRTSVQELNNLAYAAGKLGVKGVEDVLGFAKAADQIKIALGEQLGDSAEAVEQIYKITNIMGEQKEYGLEESLLKTGSAINYLTMNSQATAQPMVDFMKRLAGVGNQAGLSTAQLVGWAGAVNALGQPVEMSATSISKMMVQISSNSKKVAQALQMTNKEVEEFRYNIAAGRMNEALLTVLQKVNENPGLSHLGTIVKDLGSEGQRVIQTISTLASGYETVEKMVRMSTEAFKEGTSVTNEYNLKNQNAAALWEKLKNSFQKMIISPEHVESLRQMLIQLQGLPKAFREFIDNVKPLAAFFKNVLIGLVTNFTTVLTSMVEAMMLRSVATGIANIMSWSASLVGFKTVWAQVGVEVEKTGVKIDTFKGKMMRLSAFMKTASFGNWFTLIATGVVYLVNKIAIARKEMNKFQREVDADIARIKAQSDTTGAALNTLKEKIQLAGEGTDEYKKLVNELNNTYGDYIDNIISEASAYEDVAKAIEVANAQLRIKALLDGKTQKLNDIEQSYTDTRSEKISGFLEAVMKFAPASTDISVVQGRAASIENVVDKILSDKNLLSAIFQPVFDSLGRVSGYRYYNDTNTVQVGSEVIYGEEVPVYKSEISPEYTKSLQTLKELFSFDNFSLSSENGNILIELRNLLKPLADVQSQINHEKERAEFAFNVSARAASFDVIDQIKEYTQESWAAIADSVTKGGIADAARYGQNDAEVVSGKRIAGEIKPYGYAFEEGAIGQDNYYVDVKSGFGKTREGIAARMALEKKLERFIENSENALRTLEPMRSGASHPSLYTETDILYETLKYQRQAAQREYDVMRVGNLEDKADKTKDKEQKSAKQEYENLINKIEEFYAWQADERRAQRESGDLTSVELERKLKENNRDRLLTLAVARGAIAGDLTDAEWRKRLEEIVNIAGKNGEEALQRVKNVRNLPSIGTAINKEDKEDGNATINQIRRNRAQNMVEYQKEANEISKAIRKAWMEQNPIGKITDQAFDDFQKLGLMFSKQNPIEPIKDQLMEMYLEIGQNTSKYFIESKTDFDRFKEYVRQQPLFDSTKVTDDYQYKMLYYKAYEYAEQYNEAVTRLITRQQNTWKKMISNMQSEFDEQMKQMNIEELKKAEQFFENFGFSRRVGLKEELSLRKQILRTRYDEWRTMQDMAAAQLEAAIASGDKAEIDTAQAQVDALKNPTKEVIEAYKSVNEAQLAVKLSNRTWLADVEKQFEDFGKNIFKLRSWYEQKGSFWKNTFGTKEERKQAFAQLMDGLKQTLRDEAVERIRAIISMKLKERMAKQQADKEELSEEDKKRLEEERKVKESAQRQEQTYAESYANRFQTELDYYDGSLDAYEDYQKAYSEITDHLIEDIEEYKKHLSLADDSLLLASNDDALLSDASQRMNNAGYLTPNSTFGEQWIPTKNIRHENDSSALAGHPVVNGMKGIVIHHTGSYSAASTIAEFTKNDRASAHAMIDLDGTRTLFARPEDVTWHGGKGAKGRGTWWGNYTDPKFLPENNNGVDKRNANDYMIGVEMVGNTFEKDLTEAQIQSLVEYLAPIIKKNGIPLENVVSHGDIAKGYKGDVNARNLALVKDALARQVYTSDSGLPLTAAEAEVLWAKPRKDLRVPQYEDESAKSQELAEVVTQLKENNEELIEAIEEALKEPDSKTQSVAEQAALLDPKYQAVSLGKAEYPTAIAGLKKDVEEAEQLYDKLKEIQSETYDEMNDANQDQLNLNVEAKKEEQSDLVAAQKKGADKRLKQKKAESRQEGIIQQQATRGLVDIVKVGAEEQLGIESTFGKQMVGVMAELAAKRIAIKKSENAQSTEEEKQKTITDVMMGIAGGSAKTIEELGWWGIPLIAVISATLSALLSAAMNTLGGGKKPETATKTKLVTGMLTYDSGNVQSFPVMGDDGRVYMVSHAQDSLPTGMVTKPTLTTINGAPALVGERGPEMVIGRETTRAMMMYAPDLLQQISLFDRHRSNGKIKTYDEGNVGAFSGSQPLTDRALTGDEMRQMMLGMQAALAQSNEVNAQLVAQLQRGIKASINKFGTGGLVEEVASGFVESRQMKNNKNVTRLFG